MLDLDKRNQRRLPVSLFVNQEYDDRRQTLSMSLDLSREGISVISLARAEQPRGRHAWLRFRLPGEQRSIAALGEIVHRERDEQLAVERLGIRFKFLFPDQRRMLDEYLKECAAAV